MVKENNSVNEEKNSQGVAVKSPRPALASFTPGPWAVESVLGYDTALGVGVANGETAIAILTRDSNGDAEMQYANARLIAAAPDLYAAARKTLMWLEISSLYRGSELSPIGELRAALELANTNKDS